MGLADSFRQLYLLLWKNYVLKKRRKIRMVIEVLWPLFLFLILMWVRTRGLRTFEPQCHFGERALPSGGILPFIRSYVCELNNSCSKSPRELYDNIDIVKLSQLTYDSLNLLNSPKIVEPGSNLIKFASTITKQRENASAITRSLKLSDVIRVTVNEFKQDLLNISLTPLPLNATFVDEILSSNPNFNYLYSNYSKIYNEPLEQLIDLGVPRQIISILYGPDLDMLDSSRRLNEVYNPVWIRSQTCLNNTNYLLRVYNNGSLNFYKTICDLDDNQLSSLFILISSRIDFSRVRKEVYDRSYISNSSFYFQVIQAAASLRKIQQQYSDSKIQENNNIQSFRDLFTQYQNLDISKAICGQSPLSIFTIMKSLRLNPKGFDQFNKFLNNVNPQRVQISRFLSSDFELSSKAFVNTQDVGRKRDFKMDRKSNPWLENSVYRQTSNTNRTQEKVAEQTDEIENLIDVTKILQSMNNLNLMKNDDCPSKLVDASPDSSTSNLLLNSTTQSCFCQTIYSIINGLSQDTQFLFSQITPILLGKILYTPNTPAYNKLIKAVNATFANLDNIRATFGKIGDLAEKVLTQFNLKNDENIDIFARNVEQIAKQFLNYNITSSNFNFKNFIYQFKFSTQLIKFIHNTVGCFELDKFVGYSSEKEAQELGLKLIDRQAFWATIVFNNPEETDSFGNKQLPKVLSYKIRMNASKTHNTQYTQDRFYNYGPSNCLGCNAYFLYGFIFIQDMLEKGIIEEKTNQTQEFGYVGQMTPYPCYINDKFITAVSRTLPLFMVLAWIYTVSMMVKDIVYEKEKRLKEFMRVMGLSNGIHWLSWFITSFFTMFFITIILCIVMKYGKITTFSDLSVLIVFFSCFTIATITQCFLISIFFNRANLAAVVAGIIYFLLYLPYTILINYADVILPWQKFLASLSSTVAFSYGCQILASFELQTTGVTWGNFYKSPFGTNDTFTMNTICLILLFDAMLHMILAWYIEGIAPGEFGIPREWYFPLQPSYWLGESHRCVRASNQKERNYKKLGFLSNIFHDSKRKIIQEEEAREDMLRAQNNARMRFLEDSIERIETNEKPGIEIKKLHKVYSRGNNHALKGLTVNFYQNEISAFLGHNGAGKSTTMHLLTGLYTPTSGTAKINGLDITTSMDTIRKSLGFVPQHNVLFDDLTVKEHLWFYARLKGLDKKSTLKETEKMLDDTGLKPKRDDLSKDLSGGMQRKLSVAISFVGGSKTVILDEPSAGVDPSGRRSIWDLLFKYRFGRTIIISTHHMDEADVLGDRIAIISNGKLIAHGTAYFLKNKFGRGYYLTLAKKPVTENSLDDHLDEETINESNRLSPSINTSSTDSGARSLSGSSISKSLNDINITIQKEQKLNDDDSDKEENDMQEYEDNQLKNEQAVLKTLQSKQDKSINDFIKSRIENAILVENIGQEMTYSISNKQEFTKNYEKFFSQIEINMNRLGIDSIGISDTTLEEIFIKLAKQPKSNSFQKRELKIGCINLTQISEKLCSCLADRNAPKKIPAEDLERYSSYTKLRVDNKFYWVLLQLYALLIKRVHRVKRNVKGFFAEIVLPVIFVCLALLVATLAPGVRDRPPLELHLWYYDTPNQLFISESASLNYQRTFYNQQSSQIIEQTFPRYQSNIEMIKKIKESILNTGLGARCVKGYKIYKTRYADDFTKSVSRVPLECDQNFEIIQNYTIPDVKVLDEFMQTNYTYSKKSLDCDCTEGFPVCPASAGGDIQNRVVINLKSKDVMYDLTSRNISDWLIKTEFKEEFFKKRYGGYEFLEPLATMNSDKVNTLINNLEKLTNTLSNVFDQISNENNTSNLVESTNNNNIDNNINPNIYIGTNPLISNQNIKLWFNTKGYDSSVSYLNAMNNVILRAKLANLAKDNEKIDPSEHAIVAINHPMAFTRGQFIDQLASRVLIDLFVAICIIFALSFIPASFLVFLLEERETNSKQLQFVSGVKPYIYWISNFIWDLLNYIVPCILCIIIFVIFDVKAYMSQENFPCLILLMLLYGWACIPLMYPLNYFFKVPSTAFVISSCLNVFIGIVSTMTTTVLGQLGNDEPDLLRINNILKPIFVILFPHYCLGEGFLQMAYLYNYAEGRRAFGYKAEYDPFEFENVGRNLLALAIQGCVYFSLNLLIQYRFFVYFKPVKDITKLKLPTIENEDEDVASERKRILENNSSKVKIQNNLFKVFRKQDESKQDKLDEDESRDFIKLVNLTKVYKKIDKFKLRKHCAVNNLSLGINKGECFGLIGVNGAGKTTTFKMITGELSISGGDVYVNNYSVSKQIEKVHLNIGYCPQTDAIMPLLTAREHLIFFARLRGIPERYINKVCEWAMNRVGLSVFADRISGDFSGGNKRKLSTAIALIGDPSVICLDEPTSGMDAKARRLLWNDILSLIKENRIVILTSHSMEECEALCTRLVIMVNGQFKCLGSPQHLKTKFGSGYKLALRLNDEDNKSKLYKFMKQNFPSSSIQETHKNLFEYILPFSETKLSQIFGKLEKNREYLDLKDYSVSQTTLDQIFVNFAKAQKEDPFKDNIVIPMSDDEDGNEHNLNRIQQIPEEENIYDNNNPLNTNNKLYFDRNNNLTKKESSNEINDQTVPVSDINNSVLLSNDEISIKNGVRSSIENANNFENNEVTHL